MKKTILLTILSLMFSYGDVVSQTNPKSPILRQESKLLNLTGTVWGTEPLNIPKTNLIILHVYNFKDKGSVLRATYIDDQLSGVYYNPFSGNMDIVPKINVLTEEVGTYKTADGIIYLKFSDETLKAKIKDGVMWQEITSGKYGLTMYKAINITNEKNASDTTNYSDTLKDVSSKKTSSPYSDTLRDVSSKKTSSPNDDLTGNWEGTYSCGQGLTNLNLSIFQRNLSEISAVFKFSANSSNPSVPSGSYKMVGTYDNKTNKIMLRATDWIKQPLGYVAVDLVGNILQRNTKISGEVVNSSCTTFTLEKK